MAQKRMKLIINPNADMGHAWRQASDLRPVAEEFGGADWAGTVYPTHAMELAKQAAEEGYELVVAVGGDGTVHEVINGLMQVPANKRPKFGVVPLGSGNDFAHILGMDEHPDQALKQILTGKTRPIDLGVIEDEHGRKEYWNNTMNIGFGGSVNIYSHNLPVVRGFLMYFVAVLLTIIRHYDVLEMDIKTDQGSWKEDVMMFAVCNGPREGGGFQTAPEAVIDDGTLNYTAVKKVSRAMMFRLIPEFMSGNQGRFSQISMGTLKDIEIKCVQPMTLHLDGETFAGFASDVHHLKIKMLPKALDVQVPNK
ncbi:MAG: diacylglycerol kinase family lipid kinase [Chloroflexi bacterium]|nr:diacylglycerol kinase family lipid kinase [Chloroflexota bacterium]MQC26146.1 diacylglycerol kinase family lipid kinase [Chloroflexota bacterium]